MDPQYVNKTLAKEKTLELIIPPKKQHWVGDGFYVHTFFQPNQQLYNKTTPFLLMDYAPPKKFYPQKEQRGVGEHPHRGFETVTFAYQGDIEHRDSGGGGGKIHPGDIQWMTAGSGLVHEEFHSGEFTKKGGFLEMVQLWINLPKQDKMINPRYQEIKDKSCPRIKRENGSTVKLIAGRYGDFTGPAKAHSSMNILEVDYEEKCQCHFDFHEGSTTIFLVLRGGIELKGQKVPIKNVALFSQTGRVIEFIAEENTKLLVINGEPLEEPMFHYGPFVMNTREEVMQAVEDFQDGKMGIL